MLTVSTLLRTLYEESLTAFHSLECHVRVHYASKATGRGYSPSLIQPPDGFSLRTSFGSKDKLVVNLLSTRYCFRILVIRCGVSDLISLRIRSPFVIKTTVRLTWKAISSFDMRSRRIELGVQLELWKSHLVNPRYRDLLHTQRWVRDGASGHLVIFYCSLSYIVRYRYCQASDVEVPFRVIYEHLSLFTKLCPIIAPHSPRSSPYTSFYNFLEGVWQTHLMKIATSLSTRNINNHDSVGRYRLENEHHVRGNVLHWLIVTILWSLGLSAPNQYDSHTW